MKLVIIILLALFPFFSHSNQDAVIPDNQESKVSVSEKSTFSSRPVYSGPFTVTSGSFITFTVTPSSGCSSSNCDYFWRMRSVSDGLPITASDEVAGTGRSPSLPWFVGTTPTGDDFYFQVEEFNTSTSTSELTDAYLITVN